MSKIKLENGLLRLDFRKHRPYIYIDLVSIFLYVIMFGIPIAILVTVFLTGEFRCV